MEYQHGGDIYANEVNMDYSANINPLGLPKGVRKAIVEGAEECSCYPDSRCGALRDCLGVHHQIPADAVICGNGAADLIFQAVLAVKPRRAVLTAPSFSEYEQALHVVQCDIRFYELKEEEDFRFHGEFFVNYLTAEADQGRRPDMVFLCNPNNPTGMAAPKEEVSAVLDCCQALGACCVVDECFLDFLVDGDCISVLADMAKGRWANGLVLKAFTKLYAMAGIRLGYGISGNPALLEAMEQVRQPWSVSSLAQAAGIAALAEKEYVEETKSLVARERGYLMEGLKGLGFKVYDSRANYIFFRDVTREPGTFYEACLKKKVLIRSCKNYRGLDGSYYRICVKTRRENQALMEILREIRLES